MVIGIDARFAVRKRRGIGNYSLKLIQNLSEIDSENTYILYVDRDDVDKVLPVKRNFIIKKLLPANFLVWEQVALPLQAYIDKIDILHCLGNTAPIITPSRLKMVSSIMDVMFLKKYSELPQSYTLYQNLGRLYRKFVVPRTVRRLSKAITISSFSKKDIMHHLPLLFDRNLVVTYLAANERFKPCRNETAFKKLKNQYNIKDNFILTLGATDPRKNTERIIRSFFELKSKHSIPNQLVISGLPLLKQTLFHRLVQASEYKDDVIFLDFVTEDDLVCLYNYAFIFLYPSLYEGFGLPPLEAMSCGVPVITSNSTSIPEIVGDSALLIDPLNDEELKNALMFMLNNDNVRCDYIDRGLNRVKMFSWKKMARETLEIYKTLA
jgi:glycosyltransferase involved in cell wall biosynthesis